MKITQLIRQKFALLAIGTATESQTTKSSVYGFILVTIITVFPFIHNFTKGEGVFGFSYMSSFLFALSLPVVMICSGLLMLLTKEKAFKKVSIVLLFSGFFYLFYALLPITDFNLSTYILFGSISSVFGTLIAYNLHLFIVKSEEKLKNKIRTLISFIISQKDKSANPDLYEIEVFDVLEVIAND